MSVKRGHCAACDRCWHTLGPDGKCKNARCPECPTPDPHKGYRNGPRPWCRCGQPYDGRMTAGEVQGELAKREGEVAMQNQSDRGHMTIGSTTNMHGTQYTVEWISDDYWGSNDRTLASCPTREARDAAFRLLSWAT